MPRPKPKTTDLLKFALFLGIGLFFIYWFLVRVNLVTLYDVAHLTKQPQ